MSQTETNIDTFVRQTFTDNHGWMRSVLSRWENFKQKLTETDLIGDSKFAAFADENFPANRMFIISSIRQYEAHVATQKINELAAKN